MYDLIIIGGGPGAIAAGVYAARKKVHTLLITDSFGGQSITSNDIQNWIGTKSVSGYDLAKNLEEHLRHQEGMEIIDDDLVTEVQKKDDGTFTIKSRNGKSFDTRYILVASGSRRRKLGVPGEKEFDGKGVVYCATCDAPLFKNQTVAVVGGGNSGLEAVVDLLSYATKIYLLERSTALKGDPLTQEKIKGQPKVEILYQSQVQEIFGETMVKGLKYKDATGEIKELAVEGIFVEIGAIPNSDFVKDLVQLNQLGEIVVDHKTQQSSDLGIWAVGDVSDVLYKQNNISAGDGIKALLNIYEKLNK